MSELIKTIHILFEQSGTFKNEFKKLGYKAYDYDIENQFNQTDFKIDLFNEIEKCYDGDDSIFDKINSDDLIIAFFPCTMFSDQQILNYKAYNSSMKNWELKKKLENNLKQSDKLNLFFKLITKLVIICIDRNFRLIIENPYSIGGTHYLTRYWAFESNIKELNRRMDGDYRVKPTQYWFLNITPKNNYVNDYLDPVEQKTIRKTTTGINRSIMHPQYARRFIKKYIIDYDFKNEENKNNNKGIFDFIL